MINTIVFAIDVVDIVKCLMADFRMLCRIFNFYDIKVS